MLVSAKHPHDSTKKGHFLRGQEVKGITSTVTACNYGRSQHLLLQPPSLSPLTADPCHSLAATWHPVTLGMFVSPKFTCWNPNTQCDGVRRQLGHEGRALVNGISALRKEAPENRQAQSAVEGHEEKSVTRGLSPNLTDTVIPDHQLQTERNTNKCALFISHPACGALF